MGFAKKALKYVLPLAMVALPFLGLPIIPLLGMKIGLGVLLSVGLGVASAALSKKATVPTAAISRLQATLDPPAARKIVLGRTALGNDLRYGAYTGSNQEYWEQITCLASHTIEGLEEIWFDGELAWTSAGGAQGRFAGYLTVAVRNPGTSANGIAIDGSWTTSCTLTGCAYYHAKFKLTGNTKKAESPFAQGVPSRVVNRGKGGKVPDPRLSTSAGGSGAQDMADQSTWAYTTAADSGRNPACQLLFYLLGWKINSKLAVGLGTPSARIDYASFITGANHCDESVAKAGGGTQPRYRSDGIASEEDDPGSVLTGLLQAMNGELTDENGKLALRIDHDDLATPVLALTEADIIDGDDWRPTGSEADVNIVRGRFTDPSDGALYQLVDYPQVALAGADYGSPDGIQRIETFDLPMVQDPAQAQRLAKLRLQRKQYPGMFSARFMMKAWGASYGRVVTLSHSALGFSAKKFRVAGQRLIRDGSVELALREAATAQYAWSAEEAAVAAPAVPTVYNPNNNPLLVAIAEAVVDRGAYAGGTTYVKNDVVQQEGVSWIYVNATPAAGNAPPALPTASNAWWKQWDEKLAGISPEAGTSGLWTVIGTNTSRIGNRIQKSAGGTAFDGGAVNQSNRGPSFVECGIPPTKLAVAALDDDATSFTLESNIKYGLRVIASGGGGFNWEVWNNASNPASGSGTGLTATSKAKVRNNNGGKVEFLLDGQLLHTMTGQAVDQVLYPKVLVRDPMAAAGEWITDMLSGPWSDNAIEAAGSGRQIGDQRNLPNVTAMNLSYKWPSAITYTAAAGTPATATISVAAATVPIGSVSVSYNAMNVGVTGTGGTTVSYFLYLDDPAYAGGTKTLVATTTGLDVYQSNGRVWVGSVDVVFPAAGTGGGSGGAGGGGGGVNPCVCADSFVETQGRGFVLARAIVPGDRLRVLSADGEATEWAEVESASVAPAPCVRIVSASGVQLTCSIWTPVTLRDGSTRWVTEADGQHLPVFAAALSWEPCQVVPAGQHEVAHIHVGGRTYAAGDVAGRSILTHNPAKP